MSSGRRLGGALCLAVLAVACSSPRNAEEKGDDLEVVDVAESVDSQIHPEDDIRAEARAQGLLGVLPGDFPVDFWVYRPGSIVDLTTEGDRGVVEVRAAGGPSDIAERMRSEEADRGWAVSGGGTALSFTRGGRQVDVSLDARGNETWIRILYPPE